MPPRRAQLGGPFGGGVQATERPSTNWSGIIDAVSNGTATLLQHAAMRKIARDNAAAVANRQKAEDDLRRQQAQASDLYRTKVLEHSASRDATNAARQHDVDWNTNATNNARLIETTRHNTALENAAANKPVAPILGSPERLSAVSAEADARAKAAARYRAAPKVAAASDNAEKARLSYMERETQRLMRPTKTASGRAAPGLVFDAAQSIAAGQWEKLKPKAAAPPPTPSGSLGGIARPVKAPAEAPLGENVLRARVKELLSVPGVDSGAVKARWKGLTGKNWQ